MRCVVGIDPGAAGAVAILGVGDEPTLSVFDMPLHKVSIGGTKRKRVDFHGCLALMQALKAQQPTLAVLEDVFGITGQSASAAVTYGKAAARIEDACYAAQVPLQLVHPLKWKNRLGVPADKTSAMLSATRLLPQHASYWDGSRGGSEQQRSGRAESALIALYGARFLLT